MAKRSDPVPTTGKGWKSGGDGGGCSYSCRIRYCEDLKFDRHHHIIIVINFVCSEMECRGPKSLYAYAVNLVVTLDRRSYAD